ncbi:MAG: hypothetical protein B7Y45_10740 [Sphingomonas sp. 28-66-16]|nr:MAG: hypothetical protein B7Y45_10740 [Sphingomonas sp. 28-66-16]
MRTQLIAVMLIAAALDAGCDRPRPVPARPALFVVKDADTTIWLFGTVHALPHNVVWRTPAIKRAIARADSLVTEIPAVDARTAARVYDSYARGERVAPVAGRLPATARPAYRAALARTGLDPAMLDRLDSWAVATAIEQAEVERQGADAGHGVEAVLAADTLGKPRLALESLAGQLALLDGLGPADQRQLLVRQLADPNDYRRTLAAWAWGDLAALAASNDRLFAGAPTLEATLLTGRNARWARWIAARLHRPGAIFVAVGAGHLAGPKSVIAMLRARGLRVARVQ